MAAISSLVKGEHFEGKKVFLEQFKGLEFLSEIIV